MLRRFPPVLLLLAVAASACGSREVILNAAGIPATPAQVESSAAPAPSAVPSITDPELAAALASATPRAPGKAAASGDDERVGGPANHNTMPLTVTLNRTCARPGDLMEATASTLPNSKLAFAASYSDNSFVPNFTYVPAEGNPTGTFTWTWEITPTHPRGDALVTVVAAKREDDRSRGASYEAPFRVADSC